MKEEGGWGEMRRWGDLILNPRVFLAVCRWFLGVME